MRLAIMFIIGIFFYGTANAEIFAGYDQFCGIPVFVVNTPQIAVASKDSNGAPIIYVDPGAMNNWTHSRIFALAHECGHHRLGHTTPTGEWFRNQTNWATRVQELQADCWAAIALRQIWDLKDINRVIDLYRRQGNTSVGGYPSGQERAANIANCAYGTYPNLQLDHLKPIESESVETSAQKRTPNSYVPPDWAVDKPDNNKVDSSPNSSQPTRFGRYLEIIKSEIPRLFVIDGVNQRFEEKGICVAEFEFSFKDNSKHIAELDFRDDIVFKLDAPNTSSIWVEVVHGEWVDTKQWREINKRSKLIKVSGDGSREDLISFQMINYVKQEHANLAKKVMDELVSICHGPSM